MLHLVAQDTVPYTTQDMVVYALLVFLISAVLSYLGRQFIYFLILCIKIVYKAARRLVIRSKRTYVVYNHSRNYKLDTPEHNDPLFVCLDNPCDTLFVDAQALGTPSETGFLYRDK